MAILELDSSGASPALVTDILGVALAATFRLAVVLVTHCNKGSGGKAVNRTMGSQAFVAAPRTAWLFSKDPGDPKRRLISPIKNNIGSDSQGLAYRIIDGVVQWESEPVPMTADDALSEEVEGEERRSTPDGAAEFLQDMLADGPIAVNEVLAKGREAGFNKTRLDRVKRLIGVNSRKAGYGEYNGHGS